MKLIMSSFDLFFVYQLCRLAIICDNGLDFQQSSLHWLC